MTYSSRIEIRGTATFPEFTGERVYMREFTKRLGLPSDLGRWSDTVAMMLEGVETDGPIYIMIDQQHVKKGFAQRREGLHIDGYWNPGISAHGGGDTGNHGSRGGGHISTPAGHGARQNTGHHPEPSLPSGHGAARISPRHSSGASGWAIADFKEPEAIILASNISAARGYVGDFLGPIGEGGDCSAVDVSGLAEISMVANTIYAGNVTALHESIPVPFDCFRSLVRLNVPGWTV